MSASDDRRHATRLLARLADEGGITPPVAVELARMLLHIAGGDGRGVYTIEHQPGADLNTRRKDRQ